MKNYVSKRDNKEEQWEACVNAVLEIAEAAGGGEKGAASILRNVENFADFIFAALEGGPPQPKR